MSSTAIAELIVWMSISDIIILFLNVWSDHITLYNIMDNNIQKETRLGLGSSIQEKHC